MPRIIKLKTPVKTRTGWKAQVLYAYLPNRGRKVLFNTKADALWYARQQANKRR